MEKEYEKVTKWDIWVQDFSFFFFFFFLNLYKIARLIFAFNNETWLQEKKKRGEIEGGIVDWISLDTSLSQRSANGAKQKCWGSHFTTPMKTFCFFVYFFFFLSPFYSWIWLNKSLENGIQKKKKKSLENEKCPKKFGCFWKSLAAINPDQKYGL